MKIESEENYNKIKTYFPKKYKNLIYQILQNENSGR